MAMLGHPKPRPHALAKRERKAAVTARDRAENRKVRARSMNRCETNERCEGSLKPLWFRYHRGRAQEIHHLKGGIGRRNARDSILARWKLHVCATCHREITAHILVPVDPRADALRIVYQRVR